MLKLQVQTVSQEEINEHLVQRKLQSATLRSLNSITATVSNLQTNLRLEWRPRTCALLIWKASRFCRLSFPALTKNFSKGIHPNEQLYWNPYYACCYLECLKNQELRKTTISGFNWAYSLCRLCFVNHIVFSFRYSWHSSYQWGINIQVSCLINAAGVGEWVEGDCESAATLMVNCYWPQRFGVFWEST